MADYPILAATLSALLATKDDPQGNETAAKLDDALRQTRNWCYDFMSVYVDSGTGKLKVGAFGSSSIPAGLVRGTNPSDLTITGQREVLQGSIQSIDLANSAVSTDKLASGAVTSAKILDSNVTTGKIADLGVTSGKLALGAVSTSNLADNIITSAKLQAGAVISGKYGAKSIATGDINDRQVTGDKLPSCPVGYILVGGNTSNGIDNCAAPKQLTGAASIDANGVLSLTPLGQAGAIGIWRIIEKAGVNIPGGTGAAGAWPAATTTVGGNIRGKNLDYTIEDASVANIISTDGDGNIFFAKAGIYLIWASAPAYNVNGHRIRLHYKKSGLADSALAGSYTDALGSTEYSGAFINAPSKITKAIQFTDCSAAAPGILRIEHWINTSASVNDLGRPANVTSGSQQETYCIVDIIKVA